MFARPRHYVSQTVLKSLLRCIYSTLCRKWTNKPELHAQRLKFLIRRDLRFELTKVLRIMAFNER